jgi:N-acetylglucosamine-6-sulfatase
MVLVVSVSVLTAACTGGGSKSSSPPNTRPATATRPNIVFILTDDLSSDLINSRFAPHIVQLERQGETFSNYFVADSLCCPSRSTIFTGLFPHDTHVATNLPPAGGYQKFQSEGLATRAFPVALQHAGYATSMLGKYLNGYGDPWGSSGVKGRQSGKRRRRPDNQAFPVPPGWSDWHVANGTGYAEFNYLLDDNGTFTFYGGPGKYGVDVLNSDAQSFIKRSATKPFMVEVATFAPHKPYTPAPRNANDFPGLREPRDASFNTNNMNPPTWLGPRRPLGRQQLSKIDESYRKRAQAVEAVDKLLADTEATLAAEHLTDRTYIVFSSDNGYHLGQHRLVRGKQTAFDTDIRVPLIVAGPGVPHGRTMSEVAQNVDLYPTFVELAGGTPAASIEGNSLVPLMHPTRGRPAWRTVALVEHHGGNNNPADPDYEGKGGSNPPTYEAIRISAQHLPGFTGPVNAVYVQYQDARHETEYYDVQRDPYERDNISADLSEAQRSELHDVLNGLEHCHNHGSCWAAGVPAQ